MLENTLHGISKLFFTGTRVAIGRRHDTIDDPLSKFWLFVVQFCCKSWKTLPVTFLNSVVMTMKTEKEIDRKETDVSNAIYVAM